MAEGTDQRSIQFYDDQIIAVQQLDNTIFVPFGHLCDNLGINRQSQTRRAQRHTVLQDGIVTLTIQTQGGPQVMQCLRLDLLPLWLSGIQASKVKPELREKLVHYQREAAQVLWQAFRPQILVEESAASDTTSALQQLEQIAEMGRAITRMAEQQIELQRQQHALNQRLNTAAQVVKGMQTQLGAVEVRLGVLEDRLHPAAYVTDAQATEVSNQVKALAEQLTSQGKSKNQYQGIFSELYRRFGVSSYKMIRQEQYAAVLAFLEDWRQAATSEQPDSA